MDLTMNGIIGNTMSSYDALDSTYAPPLSGGYDAPQNGYNPPQPTYNGGQPTYGQPTYGQPTYNGQRVDFNIPQTDFNIPPDSQVEVNQIFKKHL